jgi:regulator of cell morphogenesis and NO signaling
VGEIAAREPASARVFERYQIDFCCCGSLPVAEACSQRGLDPAALLAEIGQESSGTGAESSIDWQKASLGQLIDHILGSHHVYLKTSLPRIRTMADRVAAKHAQRHGDFLKPLAEVIAALQAELDSHLMKEEVVLFPLIRGIEEANKSAQPLAAKHCGAVGNPIRFMMMEHDSAGEALTHLRALTAGFVPPDDACSTFRAPYFELGQMERDLHRHIHLENNILFPRAIELEAAF